MFGLSYHCVEKYFTLSNGTLGKGAIIDEGEYAEGMDTINWSYKSGKGRPSE
jgi:hypothetical protein